MRARATFLVAQRERRLRLVAAACAILFGLEAALSAGLAGAGDELLAVNSAVKAVVFSAICILAARDVRRFGRLLTLVIAGEALAVAGFAGAIALSGRVIPQDVVASAAEAEALAWAWTAGSALVVVALGWARVVAGRAAHGLAYVMALEFETLAAVADAMTDTATVAGEDVARNVDDYLASFRSRRRKEVRIALLGFALRPLLGLRASSSTSASTATRAATRWSATRRRPHPRTRAGTPVSRRRACRRGRSRPTWSPSAAERPPASSPAGWRRASGMCS